MQALNRWTVDSYDTVDTYSYNMREPFSYYNAIKLALFPGLPCFFFFFFCSSVCVQYNPPYILHIKEQKPLPNKCRVTFFKVCGLRQLT